MIERLLPVIVSHVLKELVTNVVYLKTRILVFTPTLFAFRAKMGEELWNKICKIKNGTFYKIWIDSPTRGSINLNRMEVTTWMEKTVAETK